MNEKNEQKDFLSLHLNKQIISLRAYFLKYSEKNKPSETDETVRVGGMEDFMTLIRVYYQSVMAAQLGISNINFLPDMAVFKRTLKIPTQNNKLGIAERSKCKKMLSDIYGLNDVFFKEIDKFYQEEL